MPRMVLLAMGLQTYGRQPDSVQSWPGRGRMICRRVPGSSAAGSPAIVVVRPWRMCTSPSSASAKNACRTVPGFSPWSLARSGTDGSVSPEARWGGWGSNPRPADYENYGPALLTLYLHGYHGVVPPMALIALVAPMARSTNRSTTCYGVWPIPTTQRHYRPRGRPRIVALAISMYGHLS